MSDTLVSSTPFIYHPKMSKYTKTKTAVKSSLSTSKNENKLDKDLYSTFLKFVIMCFIQRNQGHRDSVMHEYSSNVNEVNKTVAKVRTIGDRLPLN